MSGNGTMKHFKQMLAGAKLPEHVEPTCLRGNLKAEHERLEAELERLEEDAVDSLAGNGGAELADQIRALEAEMRENTYPIRLRAMSRPAFRAFLAEFPPRLDDEGKANKLDDTFGFDIDSGAEALLRRSIVDPELDDADFAALTATLTENQFDTLFMAAIRLNRGDVDVPKSRAASRLNRLTADGSSSPTDLV
ncbi:MAG TPA: hypothetical protein VHK64_08550 [Nocardioidaceae bacterium]|nr:hypothetical protein [Nocardioidaceae bacterium]